MKTQGEIIQQAVDIVKKKGRKKLYITKEEEREAKNKTNRKIRERTNTLVIHYDKLEDEEMNTRMKKSVVSYIRPLLNNFIKKNKKTF